MLGGGGLEPPPPAHAPRSSPEFPAGAGISPTGLFVGSRLDVRATPGLFDRDGLPGLRPGRRSLLGGDFLAPSGVVGRRSRSVHGRHSRLVTARLLYHVLAPGAIGSSPFSRIRWPGLPDRLTGAPPSYPISSSIRSAPHRAWLERRRSLPCAVDTRPTRRLPSSEGLRIEHRRRLARRILESVRDRRGRARCEPHPRGTHRPLCAHAFAPRMPDGAIRRPASILARTALSIPFDPVDR